MYLFNDAKHILKDRLLEIFVGDDNEMDDNFDIVGKQKHEQAVSECKKLRTFSKTVVGRNIKALSEK